MRQGTHEARATPGPRVDLRAAVRAAQPLELPDVGALTLDELARTREHWRIHMTAELASARVFAGLVPQVMAAGLDFEVVRATTDMAREEVAHGLESARVYAALGGDPCSHLPRLDPVPNHAEVDASPLEVVLRNVMSVSCCGETLAVAVIGAERERAQPGPLRDVLTRILADEVGHARFGWRLLRDLLPSAEPGLARRLSAYLVAVFERDLRELVSARDDASASFVALSLGAPDGPLAWSTFLSSVREVTIPGLERHGVKATWAFDEAWRRVLGDEPMPPVDVDASTSPDSRDLTG